MTEQTEQERIDALIKTAGKFLFFAQQGLIGSGKHNAGQVITGLAQVGLLAGVGKEDWGAIVAESARFFNEVMTEGTRAAQA
jgi:hypothetical protein